MPLPANLRLNAFKYPIAFIRLIELIFIIIALSSINGWFYRLNFNCPSTSTNDTETLKRSASFNTFSFDSIKVNSCDTPNEPTAVWKEGEGFSSSSGFFYFVQCLALISLLIGIFFYVVLWELYQNEGRFRLGDLALTSLCFILFFFCSSIWWSSSNGIGFVGSQEHVTQLLKENSRFNVTDSSVEIETKNSLLTISVLCAWVSVVLYAFNGWYIWKEINPTPSSQPTSIA
ncbi:sph-1 [Pristionchus pacificus]|uniref:Sph-1 n=1 Tax=Pristionchus pacificus TaxID=54126 RepID=A0A2A6C3C0_PRIPA|nr:sph-1 [Pristionchus pacificus]|eukprot:PDM72521.1 sph-1 [Pristionchus pacificus]